LINSSYSGNIAISEILLTHGADVNLQNTVSCVAISKQCYDDEACIADLGRIHALMRACFMGHKAIAMKLIEFGASTDLANNVRTTALMRVVVWGC
jgi:ankyrin repeat protein